MKERRRGRIRKEQMRTRESESESYSPFLMRFEGSVQRHEKEKEKEIKEKKKEKKSEEKPGIRKAPLSAKSGSYAAQLRSESRSAFSRFR